MAYYPGWVGDAFLPERIDFSRFDWIDYAFAEPDENFALGQEGSNTLSRLVSVAHNNGKKVKLSVGGWDGSKFFSYAVRNESSRRTFVTNVAERYGNLLEFFKLLRAVLPPAARITAAVQTSPFTGANGEPVKDVRAFADVLDWVLLMNYDVWGASPNPGPNAPLSNACQNSSQPTGNAEAAVDAWMAAGFPSNKLVLGVPSYGYISRSTARQLRQRSGNPRDVHAVTDEGADSGQVQFRNLVDKNVLCKDPAGPGVYTGCNGFTREWDACSSTPFLHSDEGQVITYDDPESLGLKSAFAKEHGLLGVNLFDVHGDSDRWELVDSLRQGLGL
ncbi:glycoside hydrolase superfamily [Lactarius quietus]|nr:glycoside hydrolase superfamily [Lactarius quietus]